MEKSSQIAWKIVPLRHFFPLNKVVPLIEVLLYLVWRYCIALDPVEVQNGVYELDFRCIHDAEVTFGIAVLVYGPTGCIVASSDDLHNSKLDFDSPQGSRECHTTSTSDKIRRARSAAVRVLHSYMYPLNLTMPSK
jgi:hypothetical protein